MKFVFRLILGIIAAVLLLNAGYLWLVSNINLGLLLLTGIGSVFLLYSLLFDLINRLLDNKFGRIIQFFICIAAVFFVFTVTLISRSASTNTVNYKEDALIVLGAGIHGRQVSRPLAYRLNAAVTYHRKNPDAIIVVSGGQGPQELITEAEAMENYLLAKGVDPNKILREEQATSTYENFLFSKKLLDERLGNQYKVAYTTNNFHIYRAGRLAKSAGVTSPARMRADSDWVSLLPDYLRECCAVAVMWLTNR